LFCLFSSIFCQESYNVTVSWDGGLPKCSNCGPASKYACSAGIGHWNKGIQLFQDPSGGTSGLLLTSMTATLYGSYSCSSASPVTVQLSLNGDLIDVLPVTGSVLCKCNTCDGPVQFSTTEWLGGAPHYKYGAANAFQVTLLTPGNSICLNRAELSLTFSQPEYKTAYTRVNYISSQSSACPLCAGTGNYSSTSFFDWNSGIQNFNDPVPSGNIVISVYATIYGVYPYSGSVNVTLLLAGNTIGVATITGGGSNVCNSCQGGITVGNGNVYQTGWPGYAYGSSNQLKVSAPYSYYVSFVDLVFQYYPNGFVLGRTGKASITP